MILAGFFLFLFFRQIQTSIKPQNNTPITSQIFSYDRAGGTFEGVTPCDTDPKPLLQIPKNAPCDHMTWKLVLSQDQKTGKPTTFALDGAYGLSQPNTPAGHIGGGTKIHLEGNWEITKGVKGNPDVIVYRLKTNNSSGDITFLKVGNNLLHLLGPDNTMRVGNGGWGYTINRTDMPLPSSGTLTSLTSSVQPSNSSVFGEFVGRTPCQDIALQLNISVPVSCSRIKWDITLYQNERTKTPTIFKTYKINVGASDNRKMTEGKWRIINGTKENPKAVIYQLDFGPNATLSLLKGDDNVLFFLDKNMQPVVGSPILNYTLSRIPNK